MGSRFEGTIIETETGKWHARGNAIVHRHGQVFDTLIGPRAFESEALCEKWLREAAETQGIADVSIICRKRSSL